MIGSVTWVGHVTCNECPEQVTEIHWGEARKTLKQLGWEHRSIKGNRRWVCPACQQREPTI